MGQPQRNETTETQTNEQTKTPKKQRRNSERHKDAAKTARDTIYRNTEKRKNLETERRRNQNKTYTRKEKHQQGKRNRRFLLHSTTSNSNIQHTQSNDQLTTFSIQDHAKDNERQN